MDNHHLVCSSLKSVKGQLKVLMHLSLFTFAQALILRNRNKELESEFSFAKQKAEEEVSGQSSFSLLVAKNIKRES